MQKINCIDYKGGISKKEEERKSFQVFHPTHQSGTARRHKIVNDVRSQHLEQVMLAHAAKQLFLTSRRAIDKMIQSSALALTGHISSASLQK
jgi:hypothetical protein